MLIVSRRAAHWLVIGIVWFAVGCGAPEASRVLNEVLGVSETVTAEQEENYRRMYQTTRSRKALRWLLSRRLDAGMSHQEVARILGEDGEREYNDQWLKAKGGLYRVDDVLYRFGPDDKGNSVYLAFRDDKLVNYERDEFRD